MAEIAAHVIFHPVRMRIVTVLSGRQWTTAQIAASLPDVAQATLYRHLKRLLTAGVLRVAAQRPVHGVLEKVYALTGDGISLTPDSADIRRMTPDDWRGAFTAYTASLMGQFEVYLQQEQPDFIKDGVSFRTTPLWLNDAETAQLFSDLRAIIVPALANGPAPDRRRRLFSRILVPEAEIVPEADDTTGDHE